MAIYTSADLYIESKTSLRAKIAAIEAVQTALMTSALKAVAKASISQYSLNDGQTIIQTTYRNSNEITQSYEGFERIKQMFINQLNGRRVRLVDSKNFKNGCY